MSESLSKSKEFWSDFQDKYWDKKPTVIKGFHREPLTSIEKVMAAIRDAMADPNLPAASLRCYCGADQIERLDPKWLPVPEDANLDRYVERASARTEEMGFGLILNDIQRHLDREFWLKSRQFLKGLFEKVGMPAESGEAELFLGNYKRTPFGIHMDDGHVFAFVLQGRKNIRAWPFEAFKSRPDRKAPYEDKLANSILLEAGPGDMIYWPASYWHVGESVSGTNVSIHYILRYEGNMIQEFFRIFRQNVTASLGGSAKTSRLVHSPDKLDKEILRVKEAVERQAKAMLVPLVRDHLEKVSRFGMRYPPKQEIFPALRADARVAREPGFPMSIRRVGKEIVVAVNGRSLLVPYSAGTLRFIAEINRGRPFRMEELTGKRLHKRWAGASMSPEQMKRIIEILWSYGGLVSSE